VVGVGFLLSYTRQILLNHSTTTPIMRISHHSDYFKKVRSEIKVNTYGAFDAETYGKDNTFLLGGYYDENGYTYTTDIDEYRELLLSKRMRYVVATNLMFDLTVTFHDSEYWDKFKIIMRQGQLICARYNIDLDKKGHAKRSVRFIDTMNYARLSVEQMGKLVGIEKLERPKWLGKKPKNKKQWDELIRYCEYDCRITYEYMLLLQRTINTIGGELKTTIGSTAMNLYQRKYLPVGFMRDEAKLKGVKAFVEQSYYGGRVEAFKRGRLEEHHNLKLYDINSMYPFIMANFDVPMPESVFKPKTNTIDNLRYEGVSLCKIRYKPHPDDKYYNYPLLPVRYEKRLVFPHGEWIGHYTHVELRRALSLGYDIDILESVCYARKWNMFASYVNDLYKLRMSASDKSEEHTYKLLLTSLYGKFGTKAFSDTKFYDMRDKPDSEIEAFSFEYFNTENEVYGEVTDSGYIQKPQEAKAGYVLPIIASYITARSRILLHEYIATYEAWYCDTDSLITDHEIETSKALGSLKIEEEIENGMIVRAKFYRTDKRVKLKGIPKQIVTEAGKQPLTAREFDQIVLDKVVTFDRFTKLREAYKRGISVNSILRVTKQLDMVDSKREWDEPFSSEKLVSSKPLTVKITELPQQRKDKTIITQNKRVNKST